MPRQLFSPPILCLLLLAPNGADTLPSSVALLFLFLGELRASPSLTLLAVALLTCCLTRPNLDTRGLAFGYGARLSGSPLRPPEMFDQECDQEISVALPPLPKTVRNSGPIRK